MKIIKLKYPAVGELVGPGRYITGHVYGRPNHNTLNHWYFNYTSADTFRLSFNRRLFLDGFRELLINEIN